MAYDVVIKGGAIYDGSGMPSYLGDVAVKDGGSLKPGGLAARRSGWSKPMDLPYPRALSIFILISTPNYCGIRWQRLSCFHGVTTVIPGNCAPPLHPVRNRTRIRFSKL